MATGADTHQGYYVDFFNVDNVAAAEK